MSFLARLKNAIPTTYRAKWLYQQGMVRARLHSQQAAIDDYTAVVDMPDSPASVRAMALYNWALVYSAMGRQPDAIGDLNRVLGMPQAAERVKTEARRRLVRMTRTSGRNAAPRDTDSAAGS